MISFPLEKTAQPRDSLCLFMNDSSKNEARVEHSCLPASPAGEMPERKDSRRLVIGMCVFLAAITFAVFGQTLRHEFINYDDPSYVYENPVVIRGLNLKGIEWAFTHIVLSNWHPLTMISHMLDCQMYGLNAGGHHLTNVLLHTGSVLLLFLVLRRLTGFLWRSAFVAAVFAIHPLHVESVAWVAERKDVLSAFFFLLTIWAYARYVEKQSRVEGRASSAGGGSLALDPRRWTLDYCLVLLFFALGLMSKPMVVTLPLVLLLLDYWPLARLSRFTPPTLNPQLSTLLLEKLPLFVLAGASCVVTIIAQHEAIQSFEKLSLPLRLGNALISYAAYLGQMFWPSGLAVLYPLRSGSVGGSAVVLSLVLLAGITAGVVILRRRCPYLLAGWLWYLIMLVPVIGMVQVGAQARADRYTYLPQIGLYIALTWWVAELSAGWRYRRMVLWGGSGILLGALIICARAQVACWLNSETLWAHTLACTSDSAIAHNDLGNILLSKKRWDEAIAHFQKALEIKPDYTEARYNLGNALLYKNRMDEAVTQYEKALQINPNYAVAHNNLGYVLLHKGRVDEAIVHFQKALEIKPDYTEAHYNFGNALLHKGRVDEAIVHFQKALEIKPDSLGALNNLAWLLATCPDGRIRDGVQAVNYAVRACDLTHYGAAPLLGTLAAAYAEAGRYDEAIATAEKACALATATGESDLLEKNQKLLVMYRAHQSYHEAAEKPLPVAPYSSSSQH
jgi:tetratricopeptide (TPR) repeat protein